MFPLPHLPCREKPNPLIVCADALHSCQTEMLNKNGTFLYSREISTLANRVDDLVDAFNQLDTGLIMEKVN